MARESSSKQKHRHRREGSREQWLLEEQHRRKAWEVEYDRNRQYVRAAQRQQRQEGNKQTRNEEYGFEDSLHETERQETSRETRPWHQDDRKAESQQERQVEPLSDFMKSYNIEYTEFATNKSRYRRLFHSIESLGSQNYEEWNNTVADPFRARMMLRVNKIVQVAKRQILYGSQFSETTWSIMENNIFENLLYEPVCETCSGRLWKPYAALTMSGNDDNRRAIEHACCCQTELVGIRFSASFGDHIGHEWVGSGKPTDRGDRLFGLLPSNSVKGNILQLATDKSMTSSSSRFWKTIDVRPGVFPFLISTTNLSEHQDTPQGLTHRAVSSMQRAVLAQCRLSRAAGSAVRGILEPLVWCFSYEEVDGSRCAIYAACLRTPDPKERIDPDRPTIRISRLWRGSLISRDRALQLLLMVDYITEWAGLAHVNNVAELLEHLVPSTEPDDDDPTEERPGTEIDDDDVSSLKALSLASPVAGADRRKDKREEQQSRASNSPKMPPTLRKQSTAAIPESRPPDSIEEPQPKQTEFQRCGGKTYHPLKKEKDRKRASQDTSWLAGWFSSKPSASARR